jgi:MFS family permease
MKTHPPVKWALGLAVALMAAAVLTLALLARGLGAERVAHTLEGNTTAIATALRIQFERALGVGMPLDALVGVEPMFRDHLQRHREVSFFALLDAQGHTLTFTANPALPAADQAQARQDWGGGWTENPEASAHFRGVRSPIEGPGGSGGAAATPQGWLLSGYPAHYIDQQVNAVVTDLFVAVLIAVILAIELMRFVGRREGWGLWLQFRHFLHEVQRGRLSGRSPLSPDGAWGRLGQDMNRRIDGLRQRVTQGLQAAPSTREGAAWRETLRGWAARHSLLSLPTPWQGHGDLSLLRMVVFLVALSDELVRPFMAVHASQLDGPLALSPEALAGIPLSSFLLTWALSQPFGANLLQRHGSRRCLSVATGMVGLLMLATAFTSHWLVLTALRGLTGMAFGFVLIFSQTLMLRLGQASGRAAAIGEFVGAVVAAGICGPVIGGLMSVKLGTAPTLVASGVCALVALGLARQLGTVGATGSRGRPLSWASLGALLRHRRLLTLLLCSAIPGKLAATAVLLLVIPLSVAELGESASLTGRLLLLYFLAFWLVAGWAGRLSDRQQSRKVFVVAGGALSALGCAAGFVVDGVWGLVLLSSLLGLGQAWLSSPQIVWATQMADHDPHGTDSEVVLGIYRLIERFGGALGPVVVASLVGSQGLSGALLWLCAALALGAVVTALALAPQAEDTPRSGGPT